MDKNTSMKYFNQKNISENLFPILSEIENLSKPLGITPEQQAVAAATVFRYANIVNNTTSKQQQQQQQHHHQQSTNVMVNGSQNMSYQQQPAQYRLLQNIQPNGSNLMISNGNNSGSQPLLSQKQHLLQKTYQKSSGFKNLQNYRKPYDRFISTKNSNGNNNINWRKLPKKRFLDSGNQNNQSSSCNISTELSNETETVNHQDQNNIHRSTGAIKKNQSSSRSLLQQPASSLSQDSCNNNNNNVSSLTNTLNAINNNNSTSTVVSTASSPIFPQQHLNAPHTQQHQNSSNQQDQQKAIRHVLSRAVSHPQNGNNVVTWVNTLIENLGVGHRKIERTQSEPLPQQVNTSRYKTELCRPYEEAGECKYGEKCQFAHGIHELRNLQRHPKYKTEYCRTFHSVGFCPYGPRCHFVHNQDEARFQQQQEQQQARIAAAAAAAAVAAQRNAAALSLNNAAVATAAYTRLATVAAAAVQQQIQQQQTRQQLNLTSHLTNLTNSNLQQQQQQQQQQNQHQLPISPPLSMSTGSDRASPTGSLSPTNSIINFPFVEQISPNNNSILQSQQFSFNPSPPSSPAQTPSPPPAPPAQLISSTAVMMKPSATSVTSATQSACSTGNSHRILQKQHSLNNSSSILVMAGSNGNNNCSNNVNANSLINGSPIEEARLPVFNRLSKTIDAFSTFNI